MSLRKILNSILGSIFIIIPFVKPASEITGSYDIIFDIWKIISIILIAMGNIEYMKHTNSWMKFSFSIYGIQIIYLVSTLLNMGDIKTAFVDTISNISLCSYLEYLIRNEDIKTACRNFAIPCVVLAAITTLTMFIYYPYGMYAVGWIRDNYFWGFDNTSAFRFIPTMYFLSIYTVENDNKKLNLFSFALFCFYTSAFIYVGSLTAGIMMLLFTAIYLLIVVLNGKIQLINTRNVVIVVVVLSAIIIVCKNDLSQLMKFGARYDKFGSLSLRFTVWRETIEEFKQHLIMGHGVEYTEIITNKLYLDHPHNLFLDVLYRGGILAFSCLTYILIKLVTAKQTATKTNKITAISLLSLLIISQMDFYNAQYLFYPMFLLGYYALKKKLKSFSLNDLRLV